MTVIGLRLAGSIQSWGTYRGAHDRSRTSPLPTLSGIAGLLGASAGMTDTNAVGSLRDSLTALVRVDKDNAVNEELFTVRNLTGSDKDAAYRSFLTVNAFESRAGAGGTKTLKPLVTSKDGIESMCRTGNAHGLPAIGRREYLSYSEFVVAVDTSDNGSAETWVDALRSPVFPPYLGRRVYPPSAPFVLGVFDSAEDLFKMPVVGKGPAATRAVHALSGTHVQPSSIFARHVSVDHATTFKEQLSWVLQHRVY